MKKSVLAAIIAICVCILGLVLINKRNEDVKESGSFSQEEYYLEEPRYRGGQQELDQDYR